MKRPLLCAMIVVACERASTTPPTVTALAALHRALGDNTLAGAVDPEALARAELLHHLARLHDVQEEAVPLGVTEAGLRRALDDIHANHGPAGLRREFEPARALLGNGRCAQIGPSPLPEALAPVAGTRSSWPAFVEQSVRAPLVRAAASARAGSFRCEGADRAFSAVFVPAQADGALVVARITPR